MAEDLLIERNGDVGVLTINRPKVYNALNAKLMRDLADAVVTLGSEGVGAIVITGTGPKAFSAGADLDELAGLDATEAQRVLGSGQRALAAIEASRVPVIAAVNGLALGGGFELILATTFPVLSEHASMGLPESGLGLIPGYGGTQRLPAAIGKPAAAHVMLTGERLGAQRAYELGLTPVAPVAGEALLDTTLEIARSIAARGPRAHAAILQALATTAPTGSALAFETGLAAIATAGAEAAEGVAAFREKRSPDFRATTHPEASGA